jgi:hypothetical protein
MLSYTTSTIVKTPRRLTSQPLPTCLSLKSGMKTDPSSTVTPRTFILQQMGNTFTQRLPLLTHITLLSTNRSILLCLNNLRFLCSNSKSSFQSYWVLAREWHSSSSNLTTDTKSNQNYFILNSLMNKLTRQGCSKSTHSSKFHHLISRSVRPSDGQVHLRSLK